MPEVRLDLPTSHQVPVSWLNDNACPSIRWRLARHVLPPEATDAATKEALLAEVLKYKPLTQVIRKQRDTGVWASNILAFGASKTDGVSGPGTVFQYRRLWELGAPRSARPFRLADRVLFRLLSRDDDPKLGFEFRKAAKTSPALGLWAREVMREGATAALARNVREGDPRIRGSVHRMATGISQFLRSDLSENPFVKEGSRKLLHPEARPPTFFAVEALAFKPNLQRERAGFMERLATYLSGSPPRTEVTLKFGRRVIRPPYYLLGDPLKADSAGRPKDFPLALYWIEILTRLGILETSKTAVRILARLFKDCQDGVWSPKSLRLPSKGGATLTDFYFPLETDTKTVARKKSDVTFRLALIAKLAEMDLEYV